MSKPRQILILQGDSADAELVTHELRKAGLEFVARKATTEKEFLAELRNATPELILADYSLPGCDGLSALAAAQKQCPGTPFIFVSGSMGEETAIEALHHGATDYVLKQRLARLGPAVRRALREREERHQREQAEKEDLTKRKQVEKRLRELNLVLQATGAINALMLRERDPQRLLAEACKILVETRGYQLAWVGEVGPGSKRVMPAARAGKDAGYLDTVTITWDETPTGRGPIGTAIRTGQPMVCQDTATDPGFAPWKEKALARGFASVAAMPMIHGSRVLGAVAVYSGRTGAFDAEELELLKELAGDLAFALQSIEHERERQWAEESLGESERRFRLLFNSGYDAVFVHQGGSAEDDPGRFIEVNDIACERLGYTREELLRMTPRDISAPETWPDIPGIRAKLAVEGAAVSEGVHLTKDGRRIPVEISTHVFEFNGKSTRLSTVRDISERKRAELRVRAFANLGQRLNAATTAKEAAEIIVNVADELLGWDACVFDLYSAAENRMSHLLSMDLIDGRRAECQPPRVHQSPTQLHRRTIEQGGQLILRDHPKVMRPEDLPFGDTSRPSASLMFVPIRHGTEVIGILSIQSYTPKAYDASGLEALQALADYGGGALERLRAQEALDQSEATFRSVWERSIDGMRLTDKEGRILAVNEAFCQLVKLPREKLEGQVFSVAYQGHGPTDGIELYQKRFAAGDIPPRLTTRTRLCNGEEVDLDISSSFLELGQRGKMLLSIFRDVSERKRAELRVAAFSDLGQQLSAAKTAREAAEIIVGVADRLLGWDACSVALFSSAEKLMRHVLARDTVDGRRIETSSAYDQHSPPSPLANRAIVEGGQLILKAEPDRMQPGGLPFGDTSRPSASLLFVPIRKGTEVIGVLSIQSYTPRAYDQRSLDTLQALADHCGGALDRLTKEEALKRERRTAQRYLDIAGVMLIAIDPSQNVLLANRKTCEVLACAESDLIGHNWFDFAIPAEERNTLKAVFDDILAGKIVPWEYVEGPVRTRRGEERLIAWHNTLLRDETGRVIATLSSGEDITGRKELETQLRQSQKMEAVGQLAGGVAHDFNNMLAVIRGNAELLLMDEDQHTAETREGLKQVVAASERAANLTRQLLTFSRKQVMQSQPLVLNEVIVNLTKMLHRVLRENIALQCDYTAPLPCVQADTGMMEQVILNLVVNARDAMPQGGQLRVATERLTLDAAQARVHPEARAGEFVCLRVSDTGTGIAPEVLPRIFEPFFTTKELGRGTGLGLATVYGIVQQHQGWIEVSSQVGQGTTFKVFLPAIPAPARLAAAAEAGAEVRGGKETILLVEDEHAVRMATRRVLESKGYTVREATTAPEALEVWQRHAGEIALLLTDIIMPGEMTGRDLAERLWGQKPGLKVVFMSGYSADVLGKGTEFIRRTHSHFLQKPSTARVILGTVRRSLDENEPVAAPGKAGRAK